MTISLQTKPKKHQPRAELKKHFQDKKALSASHFHDLIASTLNKRDDHFYGIWQEGSYFHRDVVYHNGFLWEATQDHCSVPDNKPSLSSEMWSSVVATQIDQLQKDLTVLQQEVDKLKQYVALLMCGAVIVIFYWLFVALYHLIFSAT